MDGQLNTAPENLTRELKAMTRWLKQSMVKLNPSKMGILWLGKGDLQLRIQQ